MISIPDNLKLAYEDLLKSQLFLTKKNTPENLKEFETILNSSIPLKDDLSLYSFINSLSKDFILFNKLINDYNIPHIILWMDIQDLINNLNLNNIISVKIHCFNKYSISSCNKLSNKSNKLLEQISNYKKEFSLGNNIDYNEEKKMSEEYTDNNKINIYEELLEYENEFSIDEEKLWERRNALRKKLNNY